MGDPTWVKRTLLWNSLSWQAGWVGEKDAQGWPGEKWVFFQGSNGPIGIHRLKSHG
jgi:hypothetical protein